MWAQEIRLSPKTLPSTRVHHVRVKGIVEVPQYDEFYKNLRPVLFILRATGVFPLTFISGVPRFRLISMAMLFATLVYVTEMLLLWFTMVRRLSSIMANYSAFSVCIFTVMATSYFLLVICIPLINWTETGRLAGYLQQWTQLEVEYRSVTGCTLTLKLKRRAWILTVIIPLSAFIYEFGYQMVLGHVDWAVLVKEVYLDLVRFFLPAFWHLVCIALSRTAESLQHLLDKEIHKGQATVRRYIALWLQLSRLASQTGRALCYSYGFYLLYMFLTLTLFVYHTLSNLSHGARVDMVLMAVECCFMMYVIFIVCDSANQASFKIGSAFLDNLLTMKMTTENPEIQYELDNFVHIIHTRDTVIDLGGYAQANRQMLISIGSTLVTYLVVLLQFSMSSDETQPYNILLEI